MDTLVAAVTAAILALVPHWKSEKALSRAEKYAEIIVEETQAVSPPIDPYVVVAIIFKESSFRWKVEGQKGEVGLMQIMPRGALNNGVKKSNLQDVRSNIRVGIGHLHYWQQECGVDNIDVWLSAYNAGKCKKTKYAKRVKRFYCMIKPDACNGIS